jgi:hypothetical protein
MARRHEFVGRSSIMDGCGWSQESGNAAAWRRCYCVPFADSHETRLDPAIRLLLCEDDGLVIAYSRWAISDSRVCGLRVVGIGC